jgi:hypothetical protein
MCEKDGHGVVATNHFCGKGESSRSINFGGQNLHIASHYIVN